MTSITPSPSLTLPEIKAARQAIETEIVRTPLHHWRGPEIERAVGSETDVFLKLELFQVTGSFKPRGALTVMKNLAPEVLKRGVSTVSAGNHAIAVAYAASKLNTSAKVVMPKGANPFRIERCRQYGAQVILADDIASAFARARGIEQEEQRLFVHPFEGYHVALGTATLGLELAEQAGSLDALLVPVGGGGLLAGVAAATKQLMPECRIYGVEPVGADSMARSFKADQPQTLEKITTIADSLGAPYALPESFALCRAHAEGIVLVSDSDIQAAMAFLFANMKLAVEPAGAAGTAALLGPLRDTLQGKRVGIVVCGANIDHHTFSHYINEVISS